MSDRTTPLELTLEEIRAVGLFVYAMREFGNVASFKTALGEEIALPFDSFMLKLSRGEDRLMGETTPEDADTTAVFSAFIEQRRAALKEGRSGAA